MTSSARPSVPFVGTGVRETILAVSVGVLWGRKHRDPQPELLPVTDVGLLVVDISNGSPQIEQSQLIKGSDLKRSSELILAHDLPIVTYNGLRFDWVALAALADVAPLIERTIDVYTALHGCVSDLVEAEGISGFPMRGDYGVLNPYRLSETNLGHVPGGSDDATGDAEMAVALWHHFSTTERALVAGSPRWIDDAGLAMLRGESPCIDGYAEWREMLAQRPEPKPYKRQKRHQITFPRIDQRYV